MKSFYIDLSSLKFIKLSEMNEEESSHNLKRPASSSLASSEAKKKKEEKSECSSISDEVINTSRIEERLSEAAERIKMK